MEIEPTGVTVQVTYTFNIEGAEPIIKNLGKIRMRPEGATVVAVNGKIGRVTITGRALRPGDDFPLVGAPHASVYGEQEVDDDAPEVVRRVFEAANGLKEATHVPLIPAAQTAALRPGDALRFDLAEPGKLVCFTAGGERVFGLVAGRVGAAFSGGDVILGGGEARWVVGPDEWPAMDVRIA